MRASPVTVPLIAVAPLVGAAAIRIPDVFGGPLVVLVLGYVLVFVFAVLPRRSGVFAMGWWLIAAATLIPPMLPTVVVPGVGAFRVPVMPEMVAWWVGAALAAGWWVVWLREPVIDAFRSGQPEPVDVPTPRPRPVVAPGPLREPVRVTLAGMATEFTTESDESVEPDEDDSWTGRVARVWPDERRREGGKVAVIELAELLTESPGDVEAGLVGEGVPVARVNVRPALRKGSGSPRKAVEWSALRP